VERLCGGLDYGRLSLVEGEEARNEEEKIQSLEGAGGFFFLGLEIGLGLGCFFCIFLMFPKLTPF
jgi:hypothetical protein